MNNNNDPDSNMPKSKPRFAAYLTVLPFYRQDCMRIINQHFENNFQAFSGNRQANGTVRTGISRDLYVETIAVVIAGRSIVHIGSWAGALAAESLIVDLNPRCLTAWLLLILRRATGKRTIVWGHLHPRSGSRSKTAALRRTMRRLAHATLLYGYDSVVPAKQELPKQPVWVAPNALYSRDKIHTYRPDPSKNSIIYVGRLVDEKKVRLLVEAFAQTSDNSTELLIVGEGPELSNLKMQAHDLGCEDRVVFAGHVGEPEALGALYASAVCAVSPGYAGLSLTQSLGFGVPILVADNEPHAPEIELERFGGVHRFKEDSAEALAKAIDLMTKSPYAPSRRLALSSRVRNAYSAETMADGIIRSLENSLQDLAVDGWPSNV